MDTDRYWFDEKGHLAPYEIIEITLPEFVDSFVEGLADRSHRRRLFGKYLRHMERVRRRIGMPLVQWIGGSFITLKELPGDIDLVNFLKAEAYERFETETSWLKANAYLDFKFHCDFAAQPDETHPAFEKHEGKKQLWKKLFGYSRKEVNGIQYPKGIIQINFEA